MAAVAFARRMFGGGAPGTTVPGGIGLTDTSSTLASGTNWPSGGSGFFYAVADLGNPNEEKILCASTVGNLLTYATGGRGADGTAASVHLPGCTIKVCHVAQDDDEANHMVNILGNAAVGSLFVGGGTAVVPSTLAVGATGSLLQVVGGTPAWLAVGTAAQFLQGGTNPAWGVPAGTLLATQNYTTTHSYTVVAGTLTALDAINATLSFTVPASGNVDVQVQLSVSVTITVTASNMWAQLLNHSGGAGLGTATEVMTNAVANTTGYSNPTLRFHLTGLTPGALQVDLAAAVVNTAGTAGTVLTGAAASNVTNTPLLIQAFAA